MRTAPVTPTPDPWAIPPEQEETFRDHVRREGRQAWNNNPDGCYFCGSPLHHSDSCRVESGA